MVADGGYILHGEHCVTYGIVESLCCMLETHTTLLIILESSF